MGKSNFEDRICIVGAGPAGLSAAYYLVAKGFRNVTVLEKEDRIGGKCCTEFYDSEPYDMGAVEITPDYHFVNAFIRQFNLPTDTVPSFKLIDTATGLHESFEKLFAGISPPDLVAAVIGYLLELHVVRDQVSGVGFRNLDADLALPFSQWLDKKGLSAIRNMFVMPVCCYGYGLLDEIPAAYVLKYMDYNNFMIGVYKGGLGSLLPDWFPKSWIPDEAWPKRLTGGMHSLMSRIAEACTDIRLNVNIDSVERTASGGSVNYHDSTNKSQTVRLDFDKLIVAVPQETSNLGFLTLTSKEESVFSKVVHNHYYTTLCKVDGLEAHGYLELIRKTKFKMPEDGYPFQLLRSWPDNSMCVFYSYADADLTIGDVQERLKSNLVDMKLNLVEIKETKKWDYFPHASSDTLKPNGKDKGFYELLEELQGETSTYYTGGLFNFELVENSIAYSNHLIETHFPA